MNLPILWAPLILRNKITVRHLWQHKSTCHLLWGREVFQTRCHGYSTVSGNFSAPKINGDLRHRAPWEIHTMMDSKSAERKLCDRTENDGTRDVLLYSDFSIPATSFILALIIFCVYVFMSYAWEILVSQFTITASYLHLRLWCLLFAAQTFYVAIFMSEKKWLQLIAGAGRLKEQYAIFSLNFRKSKFCSVLN